MKERLPFGGTASNVAVCCQLGGLRLTCLTGREGKHHDVIKCPAVVRVRRVEGQLPAGFTAKVQKEGAVHHGNRETAEAFPLPDGLIVWGSLIVALRVSEESTLGTESGSTNVQMSFTPAVLKCVFCDCNWMVLGHMEAQVLRTEGGL